VLSTTHNIRINTQNCNTRIKKNEHKKIIQYQNLARDANRLQNAKCKVIAVIVMGSGSGVLGTTEEHEES